MKSKSFPLYNLTIQTQSRLPANTILKKKNLFKSQTLISFSQTHDSLLLLSDSLLLLAATPTAVGSSSSSMTKMNKNNPSLPSSPFHSSLLCTRNSKPHSVFVDGTHLVTHKPHDFIDGHITSINTFSWPHVPPFKLYLSSLFSLNILHTYICLVLYSF